MSNWKAGSLGTKGESNGGNVTPTLAGGGGAPAAGDVIVVVATSEDNVNWSVSGYTQLKQIRPTAGEQFAIWAKDAVGGDSNPTVTHTGGNSIVANCGVIENCDSVANWIVGAGSSSSGAAGSVDPGLIDNCLMIMAGGLDDDQAVSGYSGGGLTWTEQIEALTTLGTDVMAFLATAPQTSHASVTGTFTPAGGNPAGAVMIAVPPAGGATAYELDCQPLSYAITLSDARLNVGRVFDAAALAYAITLADARLNVGRTLDAAPLSYAITLADADLVLDTGGVAYELGLDPVSYVIALADAKLNVGRTINAAPLSFSITPSQAALNKHRVLGLDPLSFLITPFEAELVVPVEDTYRITDFATCADAVAAGYRLQYVHHGTYWLAMFEKYLEPEQLDISVLAAAPGAIPVRHYGTGVTQEEACAHALRSLNSWRDNRYDVQQHPITGAPQGGHTEDLT